MNCWNCENLLFMSYLFGKTEIDKKCEICGERFKGNVKSYIVILKL